ncbi:hypothetical protein [Intrasporangium oryzae]|nr:hypothetical protein [Intrasporangium oryzae]
MSSPAAESATTPSGSSVATPDTGAVAAGRNRSGRRTRIAPRA